MIAVILNILPDYLCCNFISYCADEIPVLPKLTTPKLLLDPRIFPENDTCTNTLQNPYNLRNAISWRKRQENVHMIFSYLHCINLKIMILRYLMKYSPYSFSYISTKNPLPILRCPYQMIFCVVYCMWCSFQCHVLNIAHLSLPSAGKLFIPVHRTGYSSFKFL